MAQPESRKMEKVCVKCGHSWWSWGLKRDTCNLCTPPVKKQVVTIINGINAGDALYSL